MSELQKCNRTYGSKVYKDTLELPNEYEGSLFDFIEPLARTKGPRIQIY